MKKRITVILEYENEDDNDLLNLDRFIIDDLDIQPVGGDRPQELFLLL